MNRILEFSPSQEEAVVSRILVLVHQAMDEHLPSAGQATRQFTKTVFSEQGGESTSPLRLPGDTDTAGNAAQPSDPPRGASFAESEDTSPVGRPTSEPPPAPGVIPPPPRAGGKPPPPPPPPPRAAARDGSVQTPSTGPLPPGRREAPTADGSAAAASAPATAEAKPGQTAQAGQTRATGLDTTMQGIKATQAPDWVTRITLALLLAGLVLLAYALFA